MVKPLDSTDFYLQAEGAKKIYQVKKPDPETEKKQFEKELAKQKKDRRIPLQRMRLSNLNQLKRKRINLSLIQTIT